MRIVNPRKPHNFEPRMATGDKFGPLSPGCKHCGGSKRDVRMHPNEDDYR